MRIFPTQEKIWDLSQILRIALYRPKLQIKLKCFIFQYVYSQLPCMDEMTCTKSMFHAFYADNDGWHVTAVDLLSTDILEIHRHSWRWSLLPQRMQINTCTVSTPANLRPDHGIQWTTVNWVGGKPGLACSVCNIYYQQAINIRAALRFLLQPMHYSCAFRKSIMEKRKREWY